MPIAELFLRTRRLDLRPLQDADWPDLARIGGQPEVARMMSSVRAPWPEPDVRAWIARSEWREKPGFRLAVCLPDGKLIGTLGIGPEAVPSCAFFIDPAYAGRGYATEAMQYLLMDAIARFGLVVIEADHFADNPGSGLVLAKLGFVKTGDAMGESHARDEAAPTVQYRWTAADEVEGVA